MAGAVAAVAVATGGIAAAGHRANPVAPLAASDSPSTGSQQQQRPVGPRTVTRQDAKEPTMLGSTDDEHKLPTLPTVVSMGRSRFGAVLVNQAGMTLYVFSADRNGVSVCTGACARLWDPVISHGGKPLGSASVPVSMIGSILRPDGSYQVTFLRRPLYYYAGDHKPGDANGNGRTAFGGKWLVATAEEK